MRNETSPITEGTFNKGGINRQPMTPRPDFIPAPLGVPSFNGPREDPARPKPSDATADRA
jgi:hypothetical protein